MDHILDRAAQLAELLKFLKDYDLVIPFVVSLASFVAVAALVKAVGVVAGFLAIRALFDLAGLAGTPLAIATYGIYGTISAFNLRIPQAVLGWGWRRLRPPEKAK